jgi:glycosyltransferase involved in cell wall biosynthesis
MRIAILSRVVYGLHGYGGLERHVYHLTKFLTRHRHQVTIFTMPPLLSVPSPFTPVFFRYISTPRLPVRGIADRITNYPFWAWRVGQAVTRENFDVVYANGLSGWGYAYQRAHQARAPLVLNPHGMEEFKTTRVKQIAYAPFRFFTRYAARRADAVIATDEATRGDVPKYLRVNADRVFVVPSGIEVAELLALVSPEAQAKIRAQFDLDAHSPVLLSVSRLEANKGYRVLVDALAQIRDALPESWLWLLVGEGPEREHLLDQIRALNLSEHARLVGRLDDATLHNLYPLADLFVHPTLYEGSSLVTLEAMAHRRAVVASATGGIPDKVFEDHNGYLARPGDARALGEKIRRALSDPARLRAMGDAGFEIVCAQFDWNVIVLKMIEVYEKVIRD